LKGFKSAAAESIRVSSAGKEVTITFKQYILLFCSLFQPTFKTREARHDFFFFLFYHTLLKLINATVEVPKASLICLISINFD